MTSDLHRAERTDLHIDNPPGLDLSALSRWFDSHVPGCQGPLTAAMLHGGRSNLAYRVTDGHTRRAHTVRTAPLRGWAGRPAHPRSGAVPYREVGLANWGHPQGYLRRQLDRWRAQWDLVATRPLLELLRLHRALEAAVPSESGVSIVHGDFRVDDLGTFLAYRGPAVDALLDSPAATDPGFPDQMELADQYELLSGRDISLLPFYQALAYFKIAVFAEGVYSRHLQGVTVGDGFAGAGTSVPELVRAGLALVGRGR